MFANALARRNQSVSLQQALAEVRELKARLEVENLYLRKEIDAVAHAGVGIVGESAAIKKVLVQVEQVAPSDATVLLLGETGTGKELLARSIHALSTRGDRTMVKVNCGALPPTLIEAELFGRERGAYTGALARQTGRFEVADGSTIFLDEIGDLPLELQTKLLRVLEEGEFERLGSSRTIRVDVRVIAATNRDLPAMVREAEVPGGPVLSTERLPGHRAASAGARRGHPPAGLDLCPRVRDRRRTRPSSRSRGGSMDALQRYAWPGNVRELRNVIERAMILSSGPYPAGRAPAPA